MPIAKPVFPAIKETRKQATSMAPVEEGFAKTCEVLFGKRLVKSRLSDSDLKYKEIQR